MVPVEDIESMWRCGTLREGVSLARLGSDSWPKRRAKAEVEIGGAAAFLARLTSAIRAREAPRLVPPRRDYERFVARFPMPEPTASSQPLPISCATSPPAGSWIGSSAATSFSARRKLPRERRQPSCSAVARWPLQRPRRCSSGSISRPSGDASPISASTSPTSRAWSARQRPGRSGAAPVWKYHRLLVAGAILDRPRFDAVAAVLDALARRAFDLLADRPARMA